MYILHQRRKRAPIIATFVVVAVLAGAVAVFGKSYFATDTVIGPTPAAVVSTVHDSRSAQKHIDDPLFSFDVPHDWETFLPTDQTFATRSWRNTSDNKGVRVISLYLDSVPPNFAVNRAVAIQPEGNRMTVSGDVSDNCTAFTGSDQVGQASGSGKAPAKWQGVNFICDTGNYLRNVVGTGSTGTINTTKLTGPKTGAHNVFLTYTDSSASPSFSIFTDMLRSFELK
jgi:hypothetical protein